MRSAATLLLGRPDPLAIFDAMATDVASRGALSVDAVQAARATVQAGAMPSTALLEAGAAPDVVLRALSVVAGVPVAPPRAHWIIDVRAQIGVDESQWAALLAVCVGIFDGRPLVAFADVTKIASSAALALPDHAPCVALERDVRDALRVIPAQGPRTVAFLAPPDAVARAVPPSSSPFGPLTNQPPAFPPPPSFLAPPASFLAPPPSSGAPPSSAPPLSHAPPRSSTPLGAAATLGALPSGGATLLGVGAPPSAVAAGPAGTMLGLGAPSSAVSPGPAATMIGLGARSGPASGPMGTVLGVASPDSGPSSSSSPSSSASSAPVAASTQLHTPAAGPLSTRVVPFDAPTPFSAPVYAPSVRAGSMCGRFTLDRLLGQGGMATVFLAHDAASQVAVKVVHDHLLRTEQGEELRRRFQREVAAMRKLEHKNIVACIDAGRVGETEYLATELMSGGSLSGLLTKRGKLPPSLAFSFFVDLVEGLAHAHDKGVVHRDLKPDNLLLDSAGTLKIADFGIARVNEGTQITATGRTVGTPAYMSPEQATGSALDGRSDLYSAGVILYELLTGRNPVEGDSVGATLANVMTGNIRPIAEVEPAVPFVVDVILARLLALRPDDRLASAASVLQALAPLLERARAATPLRGPTLAGDDGALAAAVAADCASFVDVARTEQRAGVRLRAGLAAFRATTLNPDHKEARAILNALNRDGALRFSRSVEPALFARESTLPSLSGEARRDALRDVARGYLAEDNPAYAAVHLRRCVVQSGIDEVDLALLARVLPDDEVDAVRSMPARIGEKSAREMAEAAARAWKPKGPAAAAASAGPASSPVPALTQNTVAQQARFAATEIVDRRSVDGSQAPPAARGVPMAALVGVGLVALVAIVALAFALGALFGHH